MLDTSVTVLTGVFIVVPAFLIMYRLRRYSGRAHWAGPDVTVLSHWEYSFIWWFMALLILITVMASVPQLRKYIFYLI